jgi:hypothetical protein
VAAGKSGVLYLLNRDQLGGHINRPPDRAAGEYNIGKCWCGPSYFTGADGAGRVVTSGGDNVMVWKIIGWPTTGLMLESQSPELPTGQDSGFFTSISSNGTVPGSAVIWAAIRPHSASSGVSLVALDGSKSSQVLYTTPVGWLTNVGTDASVFPVVANGKVYVAAGHHFSILGLGASGQVTVPVDARDLAGPPRVADHEVYGRVTKIDGPIFDLRTRTGKILHVDGSDAINKHRSVAIVPGEPVGVDGTYSGPDTIRARLVFRAKNSPLLWYADK